MVTTAFSRLQAHDAAEFEPTILNWRGQAWWREEKEGESWENAGSVGCTSAGGSPMTEDGNEAHQLRVRSTLSPTFTNFVATEFDISVRVRRYTA